jgi:REP element-mobilizing transposase RayT
MSTARQILPGSTYLLTRRTAGRQFLLRPDPFVRQAFGYVLAAAAAKYGVEIHCAVVVSDHYHAVVTDPNGVVPAFVAWVNRLTAVLVNSYRGREEAVWSSAKPSIVRLETEEDVLERLTYTFANPVKAALVERSNRWPGLVTSPEDLLEPDGEEFQRPDRFFDAGGQMPTRVRLKMSRPPGLDELSDAELVGRIRGALTRREEELAEARKAARVKCLGVARVLRTPWTSTPGTVASRRTGSPHIAARDPDARERALERLRRFRDDYSDALNRWRAGDRDAVFPAGTYAMREIHRVRCHAPPGETQFRGAA